MEQACCHWTLQVQWVPAYTVNSCGCRLLHGLVQCGTLRMTPYSGPTQPSCDR